MFAPITSEVEEPAVHLKVSETPSLRSSGRRKALSALASLTETVGSPPDADAPRISREQIAAFRLSRHHLAPRAASTDLATVAGDMAGAQAQVLSAAQMSLWARTRDLRAADVDAALSEYRTLVKSWCIRGALHIIPSRDFAVFLRGGARREARSTAWLIRAGIPVDAVDRLVGATRDSLDRPLTRAEIAERVSASLGIKTVAKSGRGWGGPSNATGFRIDRTTLSVDGIVFLTCLRGFACFGPPRGAETTFVRPEDWIPEWHDMPVEVAELELLRRYLRAHGPATVRDFALWTYMTAADARDVWSRLEAELSPVDVRGRAGWVLRDDLPELERAKLDGPVVRLLPSFDSLLLGLKDKSHLVDATHYKRVYRPQGWLSPVVLVDGRIEGVWSHERKGRRLAVRVQPFHTMLAKIRAQVRVEADDLARFLDIPNASVRFS